ncbi:hypothetical protein RSAG8_09142, partial [Rhizoctonia solani AG-8 WAC10335]
MFIRKLRQSPLVDEHQLYADIVSTDPTPSITHRGTPDPTKRSIQVGRIENLFSHRRNSFAPW